MIYDKIETVKYFIFSDDYKSLMNSDISMKYNLKF